MKEDWLDKKWIDATPLIIFLLFNVFFFLCQQLLTTEYVANFTLNPLSDFSNVTKQYSGQFAWVFFIGINAFLGVVGLIIYFLLIYKSKSSFKYAIICMLIFAFFGFISWNSNSPVITPVINSALKNSGVTHPRILYATQVVNFIADMIAIATAFSIFAILSRKNDVALSAEDSRNNLDINLRNLLDKVEELRLVLYIATLLLVVGILRMSAVLNWATKFISVADLKDTSEFFSAFTLTIGSLYTILLASMYIPAYYILQKRASAFIDDSKYTKDDLSTDFNLEFFGFSIKDSLPRILAIIAPFLTGAIAEQFLKAIKPQ